MKLKIEDIDGKSYEEIGKLVVKKLSEEEGIAVETEKTENFGDCIETWKCEKCGSVFSFEGKPKFCPGCGEKLSDTITPYQLPEEMYPSKKGYPYPKEKYPEYPYNETEDKNEFSEIFNLENVPIFATGTHNGRKFTEKDLEKMEENFEKLRNWVKPPLKLGHSGKFTFDGKPAVGWVSKLKKVGNLLLADISSIPKRVYELIRNGAWKRISAEIYPNFNGPDNKEYGMTLAGVAILGEDIPAVKTLPDVEALYNSASDSNSIWTFEINFDGGEEEMTEEETKEKEELMIKLKESQELIEKLQAEIEEMRRNQREKEFETLLETFVEKGKITPGMKEIAFEILKDAVTPTLNFDERTEKITTRFIDFIKLLPDSISFKEETVKLDSETEEVDTITLGENLEDEELDKKVRKMMEERKLEDTPENYAKTLVELSRRK